MTDRKKELWKALRQQALDNQQLQVLKNSISKLSDDEVILSLESINKSANSINRIFPVSDKKHRKSFANAIDFRFEPKDIAQSVVKESEEVLSKHEFLGFFVPLNQFKDIRADISKISNPLLPCLDPSFSGANNRNTICLVIQDNDYKIVSIVAARLLKVDSANLWDAISIDQLLSALPSQGSVYSFNEATYFKGEEVKGNVVIFGSAWIQGSLENSDVELSVMRALYATAISVWNVDHFIGFYREKIALSIAKIGQIEEELEDTDDTVTITLEEGVGIRCELRTVGRDQVIEALSTNALSNQKLTLQLPLQQFNGQDSDQYDTRQVQLY